MQWLTDLYCKCCDRYFVTINSLKRHKFIYQNKNFVYPCCSQPFLGIGNFLHECPSSPDKSEELSEPPETLKDCCDNEGNSSTPLFKCHNCQKLFKRYQSLKSHILKHPSDHNFSCVKCNKLFFSKTALKKHLCLLDDAGRFLCGCLNYFYNLKKFLEHVGVHRPYICCVCRKSNTTLNNLINHIRTHTKEKPFQCLVCHTSFGVRESLAAHLKLHKGEKSYGCSKCGYVASTKWNLKLHEKTHVPSIDRRRDFLCATCGSCFYLKHHLRRHIKMHTPNQEHLCRVCGQLFTQSSYLERHLRKHTQDPELGKKCPDCLVVLQKDEQYQHHLNTDHFKFVCRPCQKVFLTKFNLKRHEKSHEKSK